MNRPEYRASLNENWPLLNTGTPDRPRFIPAEFCTVLSTAYKTKLNDSDSEAMINFACHRPGNNYHFITTRGKDLLQHRANLLVRVSRVQIAAIASLLTILSRANSVSKSAKT